MKTTYSLFKKYQVAAQNVSDFLNKYYKQERFTGRGEEYANSLIESNEKDLKEYGFCCISKHDSVTGEIVSFYN
ncbi:hypothetical protein [Gottfriedia solisilvae]|uniref:hypothetical protein n=1 Tax=Gottfriedia solisilvae TaxID=1516104 RepID=UPI003D2F27A5